MYGACASTQGAYEVNDHRLSLLAELAGRAALDVVALFTLAELARRAALDVHHQPGVGLRDDAHAAADAATTSPAVELRVPRRAHAQDTQSNPGQSPASQYRSMWWSHIIKILSRSNWAKVI